jgi:hypothetical protein
MCYKQRFIGRLDPLSSKDVRWARAKIWCLTALGVVAVNGCRFRYEQLELVSSSGGDDAGDGGGAAAGSRASDGTSGAMDEPAGSANGGAVGTEEGGAGSGVGAGGTSAAVGGTDSGSGGIGTGGSTGGGDPGGTGPGGAGPGPGVCVPDATCSCEVFQGHDYRFCPVLATRDAGATDCQSANMALIRVETAEEDAWLIQQFTERGMFLGTGDSIVFLGGNDIQVEGEWRWEDGTLFWNGAAVGGLYTNFAYPPKNNQGDCLGMTSEGKWDGRSCFSSNATVACESP